MRDLDKQGVADSNKMIPLIHLALLGTVCHVCIDPVFIRDWILLNTLDRVIKINTVYTTLILQRIINYLILGNHCTMDNIP